ncbi:hypothetical protein PRZ48_011829 [Zasmidium cellare]|uniref:Uncharacterized protein n=1 Tax=Zasmidium cellare TaxID=395010 RepID=A0ABR0E7Y6_ZASCE|nr:hypothetical protein PRZ48_011829 [Zasmidium cellare]
MRQTQDFDRRYAQGRPRHNINPRQGTVINRQAVGINGARQYGNLQNEQHRHTIREDRWDDYFVQKSKQWSTRLKHKTFRASGSQTRMKRTQLVASIRRIIGPERCYYLCIPVHRRPQTALPANPFDCSRVLSLQMWALLLVHALRGQTLPLHEAQVRIFNLLPLWLLNLNPPTIRGRQHPLKATQARHRRVDLLVSSLALEMLLLQAQYQALPPPPSLHEAWVRLISLCMEQLLNHKHFTVQQHQHQSELLHGHISSSSSPMAKSMACSWKPGHLTTASVLRKLLSNPYAKQA